MRLFKERRRTRLPEKICLESLRMVLTIFLSLKRKFTRLIKLLWSSSNSLRMLKLKLKR